MGQLEKGELSLESDWQSWDEVRKHSVLSQTLNSLSTLNNRTKQNPPKDNNKQNNSTKAQGNQNTNTGSTNTKTFAKPCSYYNTGKCNKKMDHGDKYHSDPIWLHICDYCWQERKDKARHPEYQCPYKSSQAAKNGEGPSRGQ